MRRVVFFSTAPRDLDQADLISLFEIAAGNSRKHSITGLTIYHRRTFCHIREGSPEEISQSMIRSERSEWHYNLSVVADNIVESRLFTDWFLSFGMNDAIKFPSSKQLIEIEKVLTYPDLSNALDDLVCRSFINAFLTDVSEQS